MGLGSANGADAPQKLGKETLTTMSDRLLGVSQPLEDSVLHVILNKCIFNGA